MTSVLLLKRGLKKWWRSAPWLTLLAVIGALYFSGYALIWWQEPVSNPIRALTTYTWFFVSTVTTVGYGDVVPVSAVGRIAAGMIAVGGIGAAAVALAKVFNSIGDFARRREKGLLTFHMKGHIVIFGNRGAETAALIRQLIADQQSLGERIVLCSFGTGLNPFPDFIDFVHGELTSDDVMTRACVRDAGKIIIHAGTDYESISIALAVRETNSVAQIVVKANDPGKEVDIERVDRNRVVCIKPIDVPMIVREIHNPGITQVLSLLLSSSGQDLRSLQVPARNAPVAFGPLAHAFRERYNAILIGIRPAGHSLTSGAVVNPSFHAVVEGGTVLDYISRNPVKVDWSAVTRAAQPEL